MNLTTLTDYALAAVTAGLGAVLIGGAGSRQPVRLWGWAFVALALAGVLGGTWHGFTESFGAATLAWIWRLNQWAIGLFGLFVMAATALLAFTGPARRTALALAALAFLAYAAWTWNHPLFRTVLAWNGLVMIVVLAAHLTRLRRLSATPWILAGIAASAVAAAVQAGGVRLWVLDHNDLFHLVQLAAMVLLFAGARQLPPPPSTSPPDLPK